VPLTAEPGRHKKTAKPVSSPVHNTEKEKPMAMLDEDRDNSRQSPEKNARAWATYLRLKAMPSPVDRFNAPSPPMPLKLQAEDE
jgi:hypothetical protein